MIVPKTGQTLFKSMSRRMWSTSRNDLITADRHGKFHSSRWNRLSDHIAIVVKKNLGPEDKNLR